MQPIDEILAEEIRKQGDISEHLVTLKRYASVCDHVTEMGVRWVCSTYAFIAGVPNKLVSYDINPVAPDKLKLLHEQAKSLSIDFQFIQQDVLNTEIEKTDLLFIDTLHSYKQLSCELHLHADKARKLIVLHDVITFGYHDEGIPNIPDHLKEFADSLPNNKGLLAALNEFLENHPEWLLHNIYQNNNGLAILTRGPMNKHFT
jgi:hypothetical protein